MKNNEIKCHNRCEMSINNEGEDVDENESNNSFDHILCEYKDKENVESRIKKYI